MALRYIDPLSLSLSLVAAVLAVGIGVWLYVASQPVRADHINDTDFVFTIDTRLGDDPNDSTFTIPLANGGGLSGIYNFHVDWNNDGAVDSTNIAYNVAGITHDYGTPGEYTIRISGSFPAIQSYNTNVPNFADNAKKLTTIHQWGTQQWRSMTQAFRGAENLTSEATDTADMSQVVSMTRMFNGASSFVCDVGMGSWDVGSVTNLSYVFDNATLFNCDIGNWNTEKVTNMQNMFAGAADFNQDLDQWDTSRVVNMGGMFDAALSFNGEIGSWDVSSVESMAAMFRRATAFNQDISEWTIGNVASLNQVFWRATNFNQPIGGWDTSGVGNMYLAFNEATSFDQSLADWDVTGVLPYTNPGVNGAMSMNSMLNGSGMSQANYDATLVGWSAQPVQSGVRLGASGRRYCSAAQERASLAEHHNWSIVGDVVCSPVITSPAQGAITNNTALTITGTGVPGATVHLSGHIPTTTVTVASNGTWSHVLATPLPAGTWNIAARQSDELFFATPTVPTAGGASNGNYSISVPTTHTFTLDLTPPTNTVSIDTNTGINTPTITFTTSDNVEVSHTDIVYTDASGNPATLSNATSGVQLSLDPSELVHTITIRTYDTAGNYYDNELAFPPIVTFTTPTTISNSTINDATIAVTTPSGNPLSSIAIGSAGGSTAALTNCTGADSGTTAPYTQPVTCSLSGINITSTITIAATDAGNGATGNNSASFTIDTVVPEVTITTPTTVSGSAITDITVTISDDHAINVGNLVISAVDTTGDFALTDTTPATACTQLHTSAISCSLQTTGDEGTGRIHISATDVAGNTITGTSDPLTIDTTAPNTTPPLLLTHTGTGSITDGLVNTTPVTIQLTCSEAGEILTIYIDDNVVTTITCTEPGEQSLELLDGAPDGVYGISYTATDIHGNVSAESDVLTVQIDTVAPVIAIERAPHQPAITDTDRALFLMSSTKELDHVAPNMFVLAGSHAATIESIEQRSPFTWLITVAGLTDGDTLSLGVRGHMLYDTAGNTAAELAPVASQSVTYHAPRGDDLADTGQSLLLLSLVGGSLMTVGLLVLRLKLQK